MESYTVMMYDNILGIPVDGLVLGAVQNTVAFWYPGVTDTEEGAAVATFGIRIADVW